VCSIALHKTQGLPSLATAQGNDFEQLAHLVLSDEFLRHGLVLD
jgi:hypothetical protein